MKRLLKTALFVLIVAFIGCEDDSEPITINESNKLIGYWINPDYTESELKLQRAGSLKENEYGMAFLEGSKHIERSSGWCGTPPITFFDFQGTWTTNDSIIIITIDNGINGLEEITWEIKKLDDKYLILERL